MPGSPPLDYRHSDRRMPWGAPLNIIVPVLITLVLFVATLFWLLLPRLEHHLMERKREMIRELTESAWSSVRYFNSLAQKGTLSDQEARRQAIDLLRAVRFGPEGKDYFWINDMQPVLIMHPYRPELEGQNTSHLTDPTGKHLFMDFVDKVRREGAGYVDYQWQWQDNPNKIVAKISYVKGFTPWGWIIGTGVYVEDVREQIGAITQNITIICLGITAAIFLLCFYIVWQGGAAENKRHQAERSLRKSEAQYRLLAETAREFIVTFDADLHITYVNQTLIMWIGAMRIHAANESILFIKICIFFDEDGHVGSLAPTAIDALVHLRKDRLAPGCPGPATSQNHVGAKNHHGTDPPRRRQRRISHHQRAQYSCQQYSGGCNNAPLNSCYEAESVSQ
jgi:PAS domain-containing protein